MTDRLHSFTLGDVTRDNARTFPDLEALVCGDTRLTFPEVDDRVTRTACLLRDLGVQPGDRVVWIGLNCHRLLELIYACAKAGAIATPLNWRLKPDELAWIVEKVRPAVVIASAREELAEANAAARAAAPGAAWVMHDDGSYEARLAAVNPVDPELDLDDEMPVLQIMTAAFAGRPKGALLTSKGIVQQDLVLAAVRLIDPGDDVYLSSGPMFHIGVLLKTFAIFHWGGKNVMIPRVDADEICRLVDAERCTSAYVFAPTIRQMVESNGDGRYDLKSLVDTVGGVPPDDIAGPWFAMTSCAPPRFTGTIGYGTSETVGMVTFEYRPPAPIGTFGRTSPVVALRIVNQQGAELPPGDVGEIIVRGPQVMAGYFDEAPMDTKGWRHTGDLGRREVDGSITFIGPNQDMVKTGMENVYPAEVENVLRDHPAIADACVFGVPDPEWGQSVRAVVESSGDLAEADVIDFVRARIAGYKKPKSVIVVGSLPRVEGRVDRTAVKAAHGA
jgi:acyl-CoA synthetase (AMP-forming)/AMP-acid ligase II